MQTLALVMGWIIAIVMGFLGLAIVWFIFTGKINLAKLISEPNGDASLSRFQFLIFTFVISMSVFLVVVGNAPLKLPEIPTGIYALLGISGGSYAISKGIQVSRDARSREVGSDTPPPSSGTPT
ncbi:MAG: hypothetical protein L0H73_00100 [Nitrococcus sp.]|nr:hypothetical protein [Nitrococcus sp.]